MSPDLSLAAAMSTLAVPRPDAVSLVDDAGTVLTAGELETAAGALAGVLADGGVRAGERVAWAGRNDIGLVVTLLAAQRLGAVFVPLNFRWSQTETAAALRHCAVHTVVVHPELQDLVDRVGALDPGVRRWLGWSDRLTTGARAPRRVAAPDETAVLLFSSGTTGRPKAAMLSHANLWWSARNLESVLGLRAEDVALAVAPLCHVGGLNCFVMATLARGGTVRVRRGFDPGRTLADMTSGVTLMFGVPAMYAAIALEPGFVSADLSGVRAAIVGGASVPASLLTTYRAAGLELLPSWGMTELSPAGTLMPAHRVADKPWSAGWPLPYVDLRVVDVDSGATLTQPGATGELIARGPQVFTGYWGDDEASAATVRDGWLRTGDLATWDAEGALRLVGRLVEVINTGGEKVIPGEVEESLAPLLGDAVREVLVLGVPDPTWTEVVVAVLETAPDGPAPPDLAAIRELAGRTLARHKLPKHLVVLEELPRTASGKVARPAVRHLAARALAAEHTQSPGGSRGST
jgi:fatty-acyl-CoA synthase